MMNEDSASQLSSSSLGASCSSSASQNDDDELSAPPPIACIEVPECSIPQGEGEQKNDQDNDEEADNDFVMGIVAERARQARQDLENESSGDVDVAALNSARASQPMHLQEEDRKMAARPAAKAKEGNEEDGCKKATGTTQESADQSCHDAKLSSAASAVAVASKPIHPETGPDKKPPNSDVAATTATGATDITETDNKNNSNDEGMALQKARTESQPGAIHVRGPLSSEIASSDNNARDEESHDMAVMELQDNNISTNSESQEEESQPQSQAEPIIRQVSLVAHLVVDCDDINDSNGDREMDEDSPTVAMTSSERYSANFNSNSMPLVLDGPDVRREKDIHQSMRDRRHFFRLSMIGIIVMIGVIVILVLGLAGVLTGGGGGDYDAPQPAPGLSSPTLASIQKAGVLRCAGNDFTSSGINHFEDALCKTLAAAILGDEEKAEFVNLPFVMQRFSGLANGDVDVLVRTITHTMQRDIFEPGSKSAFTFSAPYYYEGMKIAGIASSVQCVEDNFHHIDECSDLRVCVHPGSTYYRALEKLLPSRNIVLLGFVYDIMEIMEKFDDGSCNVLAETPYAITESKARENGFQGDYAMTDQYFTKDPLSMVTRSDDPVFSDFVNSVLQSLLVAEQHGITQDNAQSFPQTNLFGEDYQDMFRNAIGFAGHFGQIYDTFFGGHVPRDALNSLNNGSTGLIYSHPFGEISNGRDDKPLGPRMQGVLDRGVLRCGVRANQLGFSTRGTDDDEHSGGMDVEYCLAVAAALFLGDKDAVEFVEIETDTSGFALLADGSIDLVTGATHNLQNDVHEPTTGMGYALSQPYYYGYSEDEDNLCLATHQDDKDWSSFVYWIVASTFYAEENNITLVLSNSMPEVFVYGPRFHRMFRDAILAVGNYGELYERNLGAIQPRAGRNQLNLNPNLGPQQYPLPGFF